jgi:hypothetical protein
MANNDHKEVLQLNDDEMLLSKDGENIIYLDSICRINTLDQLRTMHSRAKELFECTYQYVMAMDIPSNPLDKPEYYKTSSLLLKTLDDIKRNVQINHFNDLFPKAEEEVERRLYGRKITTNVNKELFDDR